MTVFRTATLRTFFFAIHVVAKELIDLILQKYHRDTPTKLGKLHP